MRHLLFTILFGLGLSLGVGCSSDKVAENRDGQQTTTEPKSSSANSSASNDRANDTNQVFHVKGVIQSLQPEKNRAIIKHEEIPNYMAAMTMPLDVKNSNELAGLKPGDEVTFKMIVNEEEGWIEEIRKTGGTNKVERPPIRIVRNVEELEEGDIMPDYPFTNALGKAVRLYDHKGKALALTFIFTRCPFPNFCPRMSGNFADAAKILTNDPDAPKNWHLFSISFDPDYDTPQKLRSYSRIYNVIPEQWDFVTGAQIEIDAITEQFGLGFAYTDGSFDHNLRTVVIDASGKVHKIFAGNEWTGEELAAEIAKAAAVKPEATEANGGNKAQ
ncbi:MAG: SCO family protein [Verrucomicrobiales bacterium]